MYAQELGAPVLTGAGVEDGGLQVSSAGSARLKKRKKDA